VAIHPCNSLTNPALCVRYSGFAEGVHWGAAVIQAGAAERNYRQMCPKNFPLASRFEIHIFMMQYDGMSMNYGKTEGDTVQGFVS